ncbi:hypothetical protein B0T25DRAFT_589154 [Lasiosphaeria hispida]|uniref:Dockerin type 1 n=1 Tax=Lasiosphaeria hispida TaxID=260671 RepID=A0AAJ0HKR4_9PEZI|nr:hypothetical protein B0T25DRAFT_589154 [Lasiosphaeria hispida]
MWSSARVLVPTATAAFGVLVGFLPPAVLAATAPPDQFTPNPRVGPGGTRYKDSPHFRIYAATSDAVADGAIAMLEAAYSCFVGDLGWRSPGLSFKQETDDGPWNKLNVYQVDTLPGAAANTPTDQTLGLAWLNVVKTYMTEPSVVVHEFGHALTYCEHYWIDQIRTGAWWETVANFVADTYLTSHLCAKARAKFNQKEGSTLIDLKKVIGDSYQVIVDGTRDTGNYYQAWPFLTYMHNNPDNITGLGTSMFPAVWTKYKRNSNETPLHARMAFVDIGSPKAQAQFTSQRKTLNYSNLDSQGSGRYRVKTARRPRYMGASIINLKVTSSNLVVNVTANAPFTATLVVRAANGFIRYISLPGGNGQASVGGGDEAAIAVANTPDSLVLFDPFQLTAETNTGLDYQIVLNGATA